MNVLLGDIFFKLGGDTQMIKMRLLELLVIISRAAAETGVDSQMLLMMNSKFFRSIENTNSFDKLCKCIVEALDAFINCVFVSTAPQNSGYIARALRIIHSRFREDLSLSGIADELHISPYYLSHDFKDKVGINFVSYLKDVRLDEACWMLKNTSLGIGSIAEQVGYVNAGYFSKVFRKDKGMSPEEFRKNNKQTQ